MSERVVDLVPGLVRGQKRNGRCMYDKQAKRELVRRCQQPGVSVAAMALAHGLNANLLRKWITMSGRGRRGEDERAVPMMLPVTMQRPMPAASNAGDLEVVLPGGTVHIRGHVSREALQVVIDCLSRRS
jgi:transposase-like protein